MTLNDFNHIRSSIRELTAEQMRTLRQDLDVELAAKACPVGDPSQGSLGAMRDAADDLEAALDYAMQLRHRPWRMPAGE